MQQRSYCLCHGQDFEILSHVDRFGLNFKTQICKKCGLVSTNPYIADNFLYAYYNHYYHPLHFGTRKEKEVLVAENQGYKIYRFVRQYFDGRRLKVFEIGAGSGTNLLQIISAAQAEGIQVHGGGLEYNRKYANFAAERGLTMFNQSLEEFLASNRERYDLIVLSHVLEHLANPVAVAEKLHSMAHEKTLFYVEVPGLLDLKQRYVYDCDYLQYVTHAHVFHFTLGTLAWVMGRAGFGLVAGNEKVESVFIPCQKAEDKKEGSESYHQILTYLHQLEEGLEVYQRGNPDRRLLLRLTRLPKRILGKMWKLIRSKSEGI